MSVTQILFWFLSVLAIFSAIMVVANKNPVHSILFLIITFFAISGHYILLNAQFLAIVNIIVYAGAIMVLFVFVVMMLNLGDSVINQEKKWLQADVWLVPALLTTGLLLLLIYTLNQQSDAVMGMTPVDAKQVGIALFGPYILVVELASLLLLAALVAAFHIGRHDENE